MLTSTIGWTETEHPLTERVRLVIRSGAHSISLLDLSAQFFHPPDKIVQRYCAGALKYYYGFCMCEFFQFKKFK